MFQAELFQQVVIPDIDRKGNQQEYDNSSIHSAPLRFFARYPSFHRIHSAWVKRMALQQAEARHPDPSQSAILYNRVVRISRTGRLKPASAAEKRRNTQTVHPNEAEADCLHESTPSAVINPYRARL
jgi:hypothetical protein